MIRKHNRRAARAAFAVAFGVAIIFGGATAASAAHDETAGGRHADHGRREELHRAVCARPALPAGAQGEGPDRGLQGEHRLHRADREGAYERTDHAVPGVHGRHADGHLRTQVDAEDRQGDVRARQDALGPAWLRARQPDALPGRRCRGRAPLDGDALQAQDRRGSEEGARPHARGLPGVRDEADGSRRHGPGVRRDRGRLPAALRDQCVHAAGSEEDPRRRGLLDGSPAGIPGSTSSCRIRRTSSASSTWRRSCPAS